MVKRHKFYTRLEDPGMQSKHLETSFSREVDVNVNIFRVAGGLCWLGSLVEQ